MTTSERLVLKSFLDNCAALGDVQASILAMYGVDPVEQMVEFVARDTGVQPARVLEIVEPTVAATAEDDLFP